MILVEVCAGSVASTIVAERGGAGRVELCDALHEGGTTPSYGMVRKAVEAVPIPIFPIIRPRGGDFNYSETELEVMEEDIWALKELGVGGFSFGVLTRDGKLNREANARLLRACGKLPATLHRAFDRVKEQSEELEVAIELGFKRILTSGGELAAPTGASRLAELVCQADSRIIIMAGAGVRAENVRLLVRQTGVKEVHGTFISERESRMTYRHEAFPNHYKEAIGEFSYRVCDEFKLKAVCSELKDL